VRCAKGNVRERTGVFALVRIETGFENTFDNAPVVV
jgi:hypothetical protein